MQIFILLNFILFFFFLSWKKLDICVNDCERVCVKSIEIRPPFWETEFRQQWRTARRFERVTHALLFLPPLYLFN